MTSTADEAILRFLERAKATRLRDGKTLTRDDVVGANHLRVNNPAIGVSSSRKRSPALAPRRGGRPRSRLGSDAVEKPVNDEAAGSAAYAELLADIRRRIATSRTRAAVAVNRELIELYWGIGREILRRQEERGWGAKVIDQLARDLKEEGHRGFSARNLKYMRAFAAAWDRDPIVQQPVAQIPWGHNIVLLDKLKDPAVRLWYAEQTIAGGWSRATLHHQIASQLHLRQGSATTNFTGTLPAPDSELAQEMIRDPYDLSFLPGAQIAKERDLEEALLADIVKFMLELGVPTFSRCSA